MADEQTPKQDPAPAGAAPAADPQQAQEGLKEVNFQEKVTELENFLSERDKEITELRKNLDQAKAEHEGKAEEAHKSMEDWMHKANETNEAMGRLLTAYGASMMQARRDMREEMVTGSTLEELQESLNKAKVLVQKIREKAPQTTTTVPAGAPVRMGPDFSAMSPREKIVHGLGHK